MRRYAIDNAISESQLEDQIMSICGDVESGLVAIDHQVQAGGGRIDVLLRDGDNRLVIAELKIVRDDNMYTQAMRYFDHIADNLAFLARAYPGHSIDVNELPRVLLVAPEFGEDVKIAARWDDGVTLWKYQRLKFDDGEDTLVVDVVDAKPRPEFRDDSPRTWDFVLSYCTEEVLVDGVLDALERIDSWPSVRVDPRSGFLSIKLKGSVCIYIEPQRHRLKMISIEGGVATNEYVTTAEEFESVVRRHPRIASVVPTEPAN